METGWKQGEGGEERRGPSLFVPALARKSIKRRNRVSIVRARDTHACIRVCAFTWHTDDAHALPTGNIHSDRSRRAEKSKTRPGCRAYLLVNINVFRTLVELIKC